jgi:ATP-dependent RNA helicase RhlE
MQVEKAFLAIRTSSAQTVALVVGGLAERSQLDAIRRGARLIVATPGRLEDFSQAQAGASRPGEDPGAGRSGPDARYGLSAGHCAHRGHAAHERQTLCYSATLEGAVKEVARKYLNNPGAHRDRLGAQAGGERGAAHLRGGAGQEAGAARTPAGRGEGQLPGLRAHQARRGSRGAPAGSRSGWSATQIHGDRSQAQRNQALRSFSEGRHRVLVATDVAARGIDVANVAHVINFDMPKVAEDFVHRVGRTGRASAHGVASTFAGPAERGDLRKIERTLSIQMKRFRVFR